MIKLQKLERLFRLRFLLYAIVVIALFFIPLHLSSKKEQIHYKISATNVKLIAQQQPPKNTPQVKKAAPKPKKKPKPRPKPKPKPKPKKIVPKPVVPKPIQKPLPKPEPIVKERSVVQKSKTKEVTKEEVEQSSAFSSSSAKLYAQQKQTYYDTIYYTIEKYKRYPKKALRFKQEGDIKVSFFVLKDGSIKDFKILRRSNFNTLNKEVKRVFKKLRRFEKPPDNLEMPLEVTITIRFTIDKE